ncbi:hypothetical protein OF846_003820 [Rhodotorula toruloides]|nr:hypothetical protein OF846_003820 [Rhodotorula toruloides]
MVGWRRLAFDNLLRLTELGAKGHRLACATLLGCSKPLEVRRRRHGTRSPATPRLDPCDPATTLCADVTAACGLDLTDTMVANAFAMVQRRQKEGGSPCLLRRSSSLSLFAPPPLLLSCFVHNRGIGPTTPDILLKKPAPEDSNERGPRVSSLLARRDTRGQAAQTANVSLSTSTTPSATQNALSAGENPDPSALVRLEREDEEPPTLNSLLYQHAGVSGVVSEQAEAAYGQRETQHARARRSNDDLPPRCRLCACPVKTAIRLAFLAVSPPVRLFSLLYRVPPSSSLRSAFSRPPPTLAPILAFITSRDTVVSSQASTGVIVAAEEAWLSCRSAARTRLGARKGALLCGRSLGSPTFRLFSRKRCRRNAEGRNVGVVAAD